jgi:DNA-binding MarR family transcriptional regulator
LDGLSVAQTVERLQDLEPRLMMLLLERRRHRSADDPTPLQLQVLARLDREGGMAVSDLMALLEVGGASASQLVSSLEAKGLAVRSLDPVDRRRHRVAITERGIAALNRARAARRTALTAVLRRLSATERAQLADLAHRVADALEDAVRARGANARDGEGGGA